MELSRPIIRPLWMLNPLDKTAQRSDFELLLLFYVNYFWTIFNLKKVLLYSKNRDYDRPRKVVGNHIRKSCPFKAKLVNFLSRSNRMQKTQIEFYRILNLINYITFVPRYSVFRIFWLFRKAFVPCAKTVLNIAILTCECYWDHFRNCFHVQHGLTNCIETKAKCCDLTKLRCEVTLRQVSICLRPPPLLRFCLGWSSNYVGSEQSGTREKARGETVHKAGSKIPTRHTVSPVYKLW